MTNGFFTILFYNKHYTTSKFFFLLFFLECKHAYGTLISNEKGRWANLPFVKINFVGIYSLWLQNFCQVPKYIKFLITHLIKKIKLVMSSKVGKPAIITHLQVNIFFSIVLNENNYTYNKRCVVVNKFIYCKHFTYYFIVVQRSIKIFINSQPSTFCVIAQFNNQTLLEQLRERINIMYNIQLY